MPAHLPDRSLADALDWNHDVIIHADSLGYSEVWVGQHLTTPWEPVAAPQQVIARALAATRSVRLGTGVEVLYDSHSVRLALELAQLDNMARGRVLFGFGAGGTSTDFQLYGVDPTIGQHQAMMREALDIILSCGKANGPDPFQGNCWTVGKPDYNERYKWHIQPYNDPQPRVAFAGFMPDSGSKRVAGERGYIPLSFHAAPEHVSIHWESVLAGAERSRHVPSRAERRNARDIFVADSEDVARAAVLNGCIGTFGGQHFRLIAEKLGILDLFMGSRAPQAARGHARDLIDCGTWFVGTPDQVTDRIVEQYNMTGGFGTLLQLGYDYSDDSDRALWFRSMELLSTVVIPEVNARLGFTPRTWTTV